MLLNGSGPDSPDQIVGSCEMSPAGGATESCKLSLSAGRLEEPDPPTLEQAITSSPWSFLFSSTFNCSISRDERTVGDEPVEQSADGGVMERPLTVTSVCCAVRRYRSTDGDDSGGQQDDDKDDDEDDHHNDHDQLDVLPPIGASHFLRWFQLVKEKSCSEGQMALFSWAR
ncbi:hypothetical protein INR49_016721 [Caranx melampygus]|nr:hypothetical protein INR49_016721 [Caranx melampygus]